MKIKNLLPLLFAIALLMTGCGSGEDNTSQNKTEETKTVTDYAGNIISFEKMPERVAALSGSFGEIWINAGGDLTATTNDAVTERGLELGDDVDIVGTIKEPDLEALLASEPDFVILSADITSHGEIARTLRDMGIACGLFHVEYFDDYLDLLKQFSNLTGRQDLYEKNGKDVQTRINEVLKDAPNLSGKTALLLRAYSSGFKAKDSENMAGAMLSDFGLENILDKYDSLIEDISVEEIISADPDYIFVTTMGSDVQAAIDNLESALTLNPAWSGLEAVKEKRYFILPQELFHYKPNNRWDESYAYLKNILSNP
ncbi:MAG: ABC transporter substrate-binding protein [Clostridiaceae bacterium]|nr:ABC transporter substrate-binding protein [Clostridiaceae bacterium]